MRCKWHSREMQSRDRLWEPHVKADGPGSCIPLWQQMLLSPSTNAPGSFPFCRKQAGTKKIQLSTAHLLLCALSPLRPRSGSYLRIQIPFEKMSISKPHRYRNSFESMNSKGLKQKYGACPHLYTPKGKCKTSHKIQIDFMSLGTAILRGKEPVGCVGFLKYELKTFKTKQ